VSQPKTIYFLQYNPENKVYEIGGVPLGAGTRIEVKEGGEWIEGRVEFNPMRKIFYLERADGKASGLN
jgi:hypothetical protein